MDPRGRTVGLVIVVASPVVVVGCGLLFGWPLEVVVVGAGATIVVAVVLAAMTVSDERRDTLRWQEAAVVLADWAGRNGGRAGTDAAAPDGAGWTLPASPGFTGELLAVGRRDGFEVGVACQAGYDLEAGAVRHTAVFVRLPDAHVAVSGTPRHLRRRLAGPVAGALAALPGAAERVEIAEHELRVVFFGWPPQLDLGVHVDAAVGIAKVL